MTTIVSWEVGEVEDKTSPGLGRRARLQVLGRRYSKLNSMFNSYME
jgi:hypothetical protein